MRPRKITIATLGTRGDVEPLLAVGIGLRRAGHHVTMLVPPDFCRFVERFGLEARRFSLRMSEFDDCEPGRLLGDGVRLFRRTRARMMEQIDPAASGEGVRVSARRQCLDARDWPSWVEVTGRWFLPPPRDYRPPEELERFLAAGKPPICVSFGSMRVPDPESFGRALDVALRITDQRAVVVRGRSGLAERMPPSPRRVSIDTVPFSWLFPRVRLVVHHGGAGVTADALRAGVPSIVAPVDLNDQLVLGRRLYKLGLAPAPLRIGRLTSERLVDRIRAVVDRPAYRRSAEETGRRVRAEGGVGHAIRFLERRFERGRTAQRSA